MADLFTRLVSGPASSSLSPRVPTLHEPSNMDDDDGVEVVASGKPTLTPATQFQEARLQVEAAQPMPAPPMPALPSEASSPPATPRDLGGKVLPQRHKSSKISELSPELSPDPRPELSPDPRPEPRQQSRPQLRPREPEAVRPPQQKPEPARTTVRIEIGRIEIRAPREMPAPVALPTQREPQGLTLADYLRGNDGRPR